MRYKFEVPTTRLTEYDDHLFSTFTSVQSIAQFRFYTHDLKKIHETSTKAFMFPQIHNSCKSGLSHFPVHKVGNNKQTDQIVGR